MAGNMLKEWKSRAHFVRPAEQRVLDKKETDRRLAKKRFKAQMSAIMARRAQCAPYAYSLGVNDIMMAVIYMKDVHTVCSCVPCHTPDPRCPYTSRQSEIKLPSSFFCRGY